MKHPDGPLKRIRPKNARNPWRSRWVPKQPFFPSVASSPTQPAQQELDMKKKQGNGTELAGTDNAELATGGAAEMFADHVDATELVDVEGFQAEVFHSWKGGAGRQLRGVFLGPGADTMMGDGADAKMVKTFQCLRLAGGVVVTFAGSAQLDARLGALKPGTEIVIQHHGQVEGKGARRVNNFMVFTGQVHKLDESGQRLADKGEVIN